MNTKIKAVTFTALFTFSSLVYSTEYVIGLAEDYPSNFDRHKINDAITNFVIKGLNPGDNLYVFSASNNIKTLAEFKLGDKQEYSNQNLKRRKFAKELLQLRQYIEALPTKPNGDITVTHSLVNIPKFVQHLSTHKLDIAKAGNKKASILLIGNALFQDKKEVAFNMQDGWFPSDGHLQADAKGSLFGTRDRPNYLKGVSFNHLVTNSDDEWQTDLYQQRIKRFWHLYVQSQGGNYLTFTTDIDSAFERFAMPDLKSIETFSFDHTAGKVEMLRANRVAVPSNNDFMGDNAVITSQPPSKTQGILKIGIRWNCKDCDIDLYAKTNSAPDFLYFSNVRSDDGIYIKDFTSSPETIHGLEQVEFTKEVDISDLNVLVNFYRGKASKGVEGIVRAYFDGKVYEKPFKIEATSGNGGAEKDSPSSSKNWAVIDVKKLILGNS